MPGSIVAALPPQAEMLLHQEDRYKKINLDLKNCVEEFERMLKKRIYPVAHRLLTPAIKQFELCLKPALTTLTWTSVKIDLFLITMNAGLRRLDALVQKVREILDHRIYKNLKMITTMQMVDLANTQTVSLEEFVIKQVSQNV